MTEPDKFQHALEVFERERIAKNLFALAEAEPRIYRAALEAICNDPGWLDAFLEDLDRWLEAGRPEGFGEPLIWDSPDLPE